MLPTQSCVFGLAPIFKDLASIKSLTVPIEKALPPEDEMLDLFNRLRLRGDFGPRTLEEAKFLFLMCARPWLIRIHCFYKKCYDSTYKVPAKSTVVSYQMHHASVLACIREICKELHLRHGRSTGYDDAGVWFFHVVADQILLDAQLKLEQFRNSYPPTATASDPDVPQMQPGKKINKKVAIKMKREYWLNQLRAGEHPFDSEDPAFCPHWAKFINLSLQAADPNALRTEKGNVFRQRYWKPYLAAESALLTAKDKTPGACLHWYENGKIYSQAGKGRGKIVEAKV